jgi:hypothetical protein
MKKTIELSGTLVILILACGSCGPDIPQGVGGLDADDFELISLNGFDPVDNELDINDYAWAMAYFQPDGADIGQVYVGTGNDMIGLIYQGISAVMNNTELGDIVARPPEIRRYRDDVYRYAWETVLDYRDVETDPDFQTIGFRFMSTYRSQTDGVNYLYAATFGRDATVWRTASGDPGTWEAVWSSGREGSVRMLTEHDGLLYLALASEIPGTERVGEIWATDGQNFWPVVQDGFGNPDNVGVMSLVSYNDALYAGTMNQETGYEIWKVLGLNGHVQVSKIVDRGGPSSANESAITPCVFGGELYWGNMINPYDNIADGFKAADVIRIDEDDNWETIVGPGSVTGLDSGFNHWPNTYIWSMVEHEGWLYVASYDQISPFFNVLENLDKVFAAFTAPPNAREGTIFEQWWNAGSDLYKTRDGETWYPVTLTGFDDPGNYGFRVMVSIDDYLYVGTANPFDGLEIWRGCATCGEQ